MMIKYLNAFEYLDCFLPFLFMYYSFIFGGGKVVPFSFFLMEHDDIEYPFVTPNSYIKSCLIWDGKQNYNISSW